MKKLLILLILFAGALISLNCFFNKQHKEEFVSEFLNIIKEYKAGEEINKNSRQEAITIYRQSGFTSINPAESAYLKAIELNNSTIEKLNRLSAPDEESTALIALMKKGLLKITQGDMLIKNNYSQAKELAVEERKNTLQNVLPAFTPVAEGFNKVVSSLEKLQEYIKLNNLGNAKSAAECFDYFKNENDAVKAFLK